MTIDSLKKEYENTDDKWQIVKSAISTGVCELWKGNDSRIKEFVKQKNKTEPKSAVIWHYVGRRVPVINRILSDRMLNGKVKYKEYFTMKTWYYEFLEDAFDIQYNFGRIETVYNKLSDAKSKEIFCDILMARILKDEGLYAHAYGISKQYSQYFDKDIIKEVVGDDVFVDCGGYIGDTSEQFIKEFCNSYKAIHIFEPNEDNLLEAKDRLKGYDNIIFHKSGVGEETKVAYFSGVGSSGKVVEGGDGLASIQVDSIDDVVKEKITFIKMDVEGAEIGAIKGAKKHISEDKPVLTICAYHKRDDLYTIPERIFELNSEYRLDIRHYTDNKNETVFYFY